MSIITLERGETRALEPGSYYVGRGIVFRMRRGVVDDAAGPDCVVDVESEDSLYAALTVSIERSRDLSALGHARMRELLWIRSGDAPSAVARALRFLTELCGPSLPDGLRQADIALVAGVRHETACRVIKGMERNGAIVRRGFQITVVA